jgi:hypothetical protein
VKAAKVKKLIQLILDVLEFMNRNADSKGWYFSGYWLKIHRLGFSGFGFVGKI